MDADVRRDPARHPRVWSLTTGEAGLRAQANGLARALTEYPAERIVRVSRLAALAPPSLFSKSLLGVRPADGDLSPPWPEVLVSCGRRSGLAAMAIRRRARMPIVLVHIQPPGAPEAFDLVITLPHDRLQGENVLQVRTALHGVRPAVLRAAASTGDPRFAGLPRPWTTVLLGGATAHAPFTIEDAQHLADRLDQLRARTGGSLLITPSRRTPAHVIAALGARYLADMSTFFWDGGGGNPYLAMLAGADAIVATSDSISMASEALATTAPVWLFEVKGGQRHAQFLESLLGERLVARLGDAPPLPRARGLDAAPVAAAVAGKLIAAKLGLQIRSLA